MQLNIHAYIGRYDSKLPTADVLSCVDVHQAACKRKLKGVCSYLWESIMHLTATERHLPYGITPCYLSLDTGERAPP